VLVADGDQRPADAAAQQVPRQREHQDRHREVKKYSQRSGLRVIPALDRTAGASGFAMTMPCTPPVHFSRLVVFEQLRHRHAEGEGGEREVQALEPQRGSPNRKPATRQTARRPGWLPSTERRPCP